MKEYMQDIKAEIECLDRSANPWKVVAMGASTGGIDAIHSILSKCDPDMPGFVVVQHMLAGFTNMFAKRINGITKFEVKEAEDGDFVKPGRALIAPGGKHMKLRRAASGYVVKIEDTPSVNGHRPSVDVLFESVAKAAGKDAIGVILTGMGADGANGLRLIRDSGGYTIGQDEKSSVVYGMPMAANVIGAVTVQLPLYRIPDEIIRVLREQ